MSLSKFILSSFSKDSPNKIGKGINVSRKNTLIRTADIGWNVAIADEPIDAKIDGKKIFCVRVDDATAYPQLMIGFTPMETFDSKYDAYFGSEDFIGCGISLYTGDLSYPVDIWHEGHSIIDGIVSSNAKEIIVILTISNNGKKKEIRFLVDGHESESSHVSKWLKRVRIFPAICLANPHQQVTTIPIEQITIRTPEINKLIKEYQQQQNKQANASDVEVETKKENKKEKQKKKVATKKTKKETKPKTTKATKKKEEKKNNKNEKKTKAKK
jgi:hypothetical protein